MSGITGQSPALSLKSVLPGLVIILLVDITAILGIWPDSRVFDTSLTLFMLFIPWITLAVTRSPIAALGFTRGQIVRAFGWGMVAGGFWRIISILINFMAVDLGAGLAGWLPMFIGGVIWVPLVEETFFRGYLLRPLMHDLGRWTGILIQALLFCLHPVHLSQGVLALISVFGFGLIAGWIQDRFGSLWAAWGAHAFANILPLLVLLG